MGRDLVWSGGRMWTGRRFVERLVAEDGRIVVADDGGPGGPEVPTGAERIDLAGRLVVPAFLDAHLHPTETALAPAGVDARGAADLAELGERVRAAAGRSPEGALWGRGWDQERLADRRMPTRRDLDGWVGDRPLVLTRVCEHLAVANSAALAAMGITADTPDPEGGTIDREPDGSPSGLLRERALGLLARYPFPSLQDRPDLGDAFLRRVAASGIAAFGALRASAPEVDWGLEARARRATPTPRYLAFGSVPDPEAIEAWGARRRRHPEVQGVKLFADGSFGGRGAWLEAPYADAPTTSGAPLVRPERWEELLRRADEVGLRVAAHALGDRAVTTVLRAVEAVRPTFRPRLEHAGMVSGPRIERIHRAGIEVVVQPGFRTSDRWLPERLGPVRIADAYPFRALAERGVPMAASSDAPVEPFDPVDGLRAAVAEDGVGPPVPAWMALGWYTAGAAQVLEQPDLGHLEPGASASLVAFEAPTLERLLAPGPRPGRSVWLEGAAVPGAGP